MKEYSAGFITGISQVIIGFPLDTYIIYKQINKKLNYKNIYKGVQYPLLTSSIINSISFGLTNNLNKQINNFYLSGLCSGILTSFIICPIELYKIRTQSLKKINISIFTGFKNTLIRESIGSSMYFGVYNSCRDKDISVFGSGGLAGIISCFLCYPFDTIKTRIQSGEFNTTIDAFKYGNLYKGLKVSLLRAFIINSSSFCIYNYFTKT